MISHKRQEHQHTHIDAPKSRAVDAPKSRAVDAPKSRAIASLTPWRQSSPCQSHDLWGTESTKLQTFLRVTRVSKKRTKDLEAQSRKKNIISLFRPKVTSFKIKLAVCFIAATLLVTLMCGGGSVHAQTDRRRLPGGMEELIIKMKVLNKENNNLKKFINETLGEVEDYKDFPKYAPKLSDVLSELKARLGTVDAIFKEVFGETKEIHMNNRKSQCEDPQCDGSEATVPDDEGKQFCKKCKRPWEPEIPEINYTFTDGTTCLGTYSKISPGDEIEGTVVTEDTATSEGRPIFVRIDHVKFIAGEKCAKCKSNLTSDGLTCLGGCGQKWTRRRGCTIKIGDVVTFRIYHESTWFLQVNGKTYYMWAAGQRAFRFYGYGKVESLERATPEWAAQFADLYS